MQCKMSVTKVVDRTARLREVTLTGKADKEAPSCNLRLSIDPQAFPQFKIGTVFDVEIGETK